MKYLFWLSGLLLAGVLQAQQVQEALWQVDFDKEIEWQRITQSGVLLVATSDAMLYGVDSRSGEILWKNDAMTGARGKKGADGKKMKTADLFNTYLFVLQDDEYPEMADYIGIKYDNTDTGFKNFAVINVVTGEEVTSPKKAGLPTQKIMGRISSVFNYDGTAYFPEIKAVVISASWQDTKAPGKPWKYLTRVIDMPSGQLRWESNAIAVDGRPLVLPDNNLLMPGKKKIVKFDSRTGEVLWKMEVEKKNQSFEKFDMNIDRTTGYFFEKSNNSGFLTALNLETGQRDWTIDVRLKVVPRMFAMNDGVVVVDDKNLTLYDLETGQEKWRVKKVSGFVVDLGDYGLAIAAKEKFLKMIDRNTGETIWEEKVKGIRLDQICGKGIMYSDEKGRLGLISFDGRKVWDKKGMLEVPSVRYKPTFDKEYMYIDGSLYEVDLMEGDYRLVKEKIHKMFNADEEPNKIEVLEGGILLSSASNLLMLEPDGRVRYFKSWDPPELSLTAKIALKTLQVAMAAAAVSMSARSGFERGYMGYETYESKMYQEQAMAFMAASSLIGKAARKKFADAREKGHLKVVLAVIGKGGQKKGAGFVKVDKRTGEELATIIVGDKEPVYDFDPVSGQVFLKRDKNQIISYTF